MKILHIIPTYFPAHRYGGPIKSVHELNKWLVKKGAEVAVYATNLDGDKFLPVPLNKEADIDGVKVFYFPATFRVWEYSWAMHKAIRKNIKNFDLIHITSVFLSASALGAYYSKGFGKPYLISPRGSLMLEPLKKKWLKKKFYLSLIEKINLAGAAAIHFTTDMEKEEYAAAGLPLKSSIIIPNGIDPAEYEKAVPPGLFRNKFHIDPSKKIVLFLSRISWKKGLDTLIPAFALLKQKNPNVILIIAGGDDEDYKRNAISSVNQNKLTFFDFSPRNKKEMRECENADVIFTGLLLGEDKIAAYKESSVFVLPSYAENFGMAVVEAMYFGLPVVITKSVGIAPSVVGGGAGLVIEKNEYHLAEAVGDILRDHSLARRMGEAGRKLVQREFSWSPIAERFMEEYRKLLQLRN